MYSFMFHSNVTQWAFRKKSPCIPNVLNQCFCHGNDKEDFVTFSAFWHNCPGKAAFKMLFIFHINYFFIFPIPFCRISPLQNFICMLYVPHSGGCLRLKSKSLTPFMFSLTMVWSVQWFDLLKKDYLVFEFYFVCSRLLCF